MAEFSSPIMGGLRVAKNRSIPYSILGGSAASDNSQTVEILNNNQRSLDTINSSLISVSTQISQLNASLSGISNLISQSSQLERLKENQKIEQENKLAQQKLREGQESIVERKIQNSLLAPVQKIGTKVQGSLGSLMGVFTTLLAGWLTSQVLTNFEFYSKNIKKFLNLIKTGTTKGFELIGSTFAFIKNSLDIVSDKVNDIGSILKRAVFNDVFKRPFDFVINKIKEFWGKLTGVVNNSKDSKSDTSDSSSTDSSSSSSSGLDLSKLSFLQASNLNLEGGKISQNLNNFSMGSFLNQPKDDSDKMNQAFSTDMSLSSSIFSDPNFSKFFEETQNISMQISPMSMEDSSLTANQENNKPPVQIPASITSPPKDAKIEMASQQEPEPKTQVVVTPTATSSPQQESPPTSSGNELDGIASGNPDNFYTLYSQINYNVV